MNRATAALVAVILVGVGSAAGYWWGTRSASHRQTVESAPSGKSERKVLHYRNPMGLDDTSPVPKKDSMGMDYIPVYADDAPAALSTASNGKVLYYRNPMGLADTSPVPKKDSMGMDYVPVYESDAAPAGTVRIGIEKVQKLGVRTEAVVVRDLSRIVRAVGVLQVDERRLRTVAPRFEGWIQRLHVNTTGQAVRRGDPLMEVYSPDLVSAQQEYAVAVKGVAAVQGGDPAILESMKNLVEGSLQRLRNWELSDAEIARLQKEGTARNSVTIRSPATGVVLEKPSIEGMRFMPGEMLYRIADLSSLWLIADVFEQDLSIVMQGQAVRIKVDSYPEKVFTGRVAFIYPTVAPETRTAKVRIELANPGELLKPSMYASVEVAAGSVRSRGLTVPDSAVLDSGIRQIVLIERGEGLYEPREVRIGTRGDGFVQVIDGVKEGEMVVVSANFLIDAESNLRASLSGFGQGSPTEKAPAKSVAPVSAPPAAGGAAANHGKGH